VIEILLKQPGLFEHLGDRLGEAGVGAGQAPHKGEELAGERERE
jgi:hypothetical protein